MPIVPAKEDLARVAPYPAGDPVSLYPRTSLGYTQGNRTPLVYNRESGESPERHPPL